MTGHDNTSSTTGETPRFSNTPNVGAGTSTGLGEERHAGDDSHLSDRSRVGDGSRPHVSGGAYNGNSEASIKSGVIGFNPSHAGRSHAALPSNNAAEDRLDRNQIVGQGNTGTNTGSGLRNETIPEHPGTVPGS